MANTYTKLTSGAWGVRVVGAPPHEGATVIVAKKSGEVRSETIAKILWSGKDKYSGEPIHVCAIEARERTAPASNASAGTGGSCAECGRYSPRLVDCPDSSGIVAGCCSRCARMGRSERSYA